MHCYLGQRDGSPNWYIYQYDERTGECKRFSTRTTDREAAEKKLAEHIIRLPQQRLVADATVVWVMLRYWELYAQRNAATDTVRRVMGLVCEHEPERRVFNWPVLEQKDFISKLAKTDSTRRRYWGVVRAAIQWAVDNGELTSMPAMAKVQATDGDGVRPFELHELRALCEACQHEHERRFLLLMLSTAPRPGSTLDLDWSRIDATTGVVNYQVPGRKITKKRRAKAPLCGPALAYFNERRSLGPVVHWHGRQLKGFKMTMRRLCKRAKVSGSAYGIRKAVSIWLRREGVHEWDIKGMLGHAIGGETERYAHYRPEYMRAAAIAVERLICEIAPSWLASYLPVHQQPEVSSQPKSLNPPANGGARDRDRTCDPYHVKDAVSAQIQWLKRSGSN